MIRIPILQFIYPGVQVLSDPTQATQAEIDAAIIECLRIFAARGRQLRMQRERDRLAQAQTDKPIEEKPNMPTEPGNPSVIPSDPEDVVTRILDAQPQDPASDSTSEEPACPS